MIRLAEQRDADAWVRLRLDLWPDNDEAEFCEEVLDLARLGHALIAEEGGEVVGFAEFSLRPYAEGCDSSPVPYLEGWYVVPAHRGRGVGRALVAVFESWARERGFVEMASDVELSNTASQAAHERLGFQEVERLVVYRKALTPG